MHHKPMAEDRSAKYTLKDIPFESLRYTPGFSTDRLYRLHHTQAPPVDWLVSPFFNSPPNFAFTNGPLHTTPDGVGL